MAIARAAQLAREAEEEAELREEERRAVERE